jgi:hypothetical protein
MHSYCDLSALEMVVPWAWAGATPMEKVDTICLVSCVSAKRTTPALAKNLYQSDWFIKARAYAESVGSCWFFLSAKYGLVRPGDDRAIRDDAQHGGSRRAAQLVTSRPVADG